MPITSEYDDDLVLTGHTDAADEASGPNKKKHNKKQEDNKILESLARCTGIRRGLDRPEGNSKVQRQIAESTQGHGIQEEERNPVFQLCLQHCVCGVLLFCFVLHRWLGPEHLAYQSVCAESCCAWVFEIIVGPVICPTEVLPRSPSNI